MRQLLAQVTLLLSSAVPVAVAATACSTPRSALQLASPVTENVEVDTVDALSLIDLKQVGKHSVDLRGFHGTDNVKARLRLHYASFSPAEKVLVGFGVILALFVFVLLPIASYLHIKRTLTGAVVEAAIVELAATVLGVEASFDEVCVDVFRGRLLVKKFCVNNPEMQPPYTTQRILCVDEVAVDINMWKLLTSCMHKVDVTKLVFSGAKVVYERPALTSNKSNVQDVLDNMQQWKNSKVKTSRKSAATHSAPQQKDTIQQKEPVGTSEAKSQFALGLLDIDDLTGEAKIQGVSASLTVSPFEKDDLNIQADGADIEDIIAAFTEKLAENVLLNALPTGLPISPRDLSQCGSCFEGVRKKSFDSLSN